MEEEHIFSREDLKENQPVSQEKNTGVNKALLGIIVVLLLVITGGGAYFLGAQKGADDNEKGAIPTQTLIKTETLGEQTEAPTQTPTVTPSSPQVSTSSANISSPTPTPKITSLPTPT